MNRVATASLWLLILICGCRPIDYTCEHSERNFFPSARGVNSPALRKQTACQAAEQNRHRQVLTEREATALNQHQRYARHEEHERTSILYGVKSQFETQFETTIKICNFGPDLWSGVGKMEENASLAHRTKARQDIMLSLINAHRSCTMNVNMCRRGRQGDMSQTSLQRVTRQCRSQAWQHALKRRERVGPDVSSPTIDQGSWA